MGPRFRGDDTTFVGRSSPHFLRHLHDPPQLRPLLLLGEDIAFLGRGEAALRREAKLLECNIFRRFVNAALEIVRAFERAGGFEPLRFLPKGKKQVVLGLVTSKSGTLEARDDVKRRIDEATKYVDLDQLCLSPQCGFASTEEGNILAEEEQWAKLRMIVELADEVWG